MVKKKVVWDELSRNAFQESYIYIQHNSIQEAEKVKHGIIKDVRFRAFEKFNYRISYFISVDTIRILRFRHVKQKPEAY